ncbi:hypothetical protein [Pseudomonas oligotrophica]|uniref:hypothetical protein n=1 Tax=Pseudomonas oligotrophica TaxID=2912055 RepID=UPI001F30449B|nr:hypothetical protein [Pseudomonas oligotrophica]MCF7201414.1 hypothetical protein [Pseudomonas oligotrophica]
MRHRMRIWLIALFIGWLPALAESSPEPGVSPLQSLQIHASRATSSLLLYRGEGFQKAHLARMEEDIRALAAALQATPSPNAELRERHQALEAKLREGAAFGFAEDDMPWGWPLELSKALRDFLTAARSQQGGNTRAELPAKVEYLAVQYLSRAYIGSFETAREQPDTYLGQDERQLVPAIDAEFASLGPQLAPLKTRWDFLKVALQDMNSASNNFSTASGRPFAPITVDRHTRSLSDQWMARAR